MSGTHNIIEAIRHIIAQLPIDLRAEVVAADLSSNGFSEDDIVISAQSTFKRRYSNDVLNVSKQETKNGDAYCRIDVSREGIYDMLPQAITHTQRRAKALRPKAKEEMIDELKVRRKEENAARKFFLPFENEFYRQRFQLEQEEQKILRGYLSTSKYAQLLDQFWQLPDVFDLPRKAMLIYIFPILNKIIGNVQLMELCYRAILEIPVAIHISFGKINSARASFILGNDSIVLGLSSCCGNTFDVGTSVVTLEAGPVRNDQVFHYIPTGKMRRMIEALNEFLLPADADCEIKILVEETGEIRLGKDRPMMLGYNFNLPSNSSLQNKVVAAG